MVKKMGLKLKHVFIVNTISTVLFGSGFLFMTETILTQFGVTDNIIGFRFFGSFMVCHGLLTFFARESDDNPARNAILLFETIGGIVLTIMIFIFLDLTKILTWTAIITQILFVGIYAYFIFKKE